MSKHKPKVNLADVAGTDRPATTTRPGPAPALAGKAAGRKKAPAGVARPLQEQIGLYVHEVTMEGARAAYLADFRNRGADSPNGLDHWIAEAVRELAALKPAERDKRITALPPEPATVLDPTTGKERKAKRKGNKSRLSEDTVARMDVACAADEEAGLAARGRNTFIVAAMRWGAERARRLHEERTGNAELPPAPPGRLPRRGRSRI